MSGEPVVSLTAMDVIVARPGREIVDAVAAVDFVVAAAADDVVRFAIARQSHATGRTAGVEVLDLAGKGVAEGDDDRVGAAVLPMFENRDTVADDIGVAAIASDQSPAAGRHQDVVAVVAVERPVAHKLAVLDELGQRVFGEIADDGILAPILFLDHFVAFVVDMIGVVAGAADHAVRTRAAIERVVALQPLEQVGLVAALENVVTFGAPECTHDPARLFDRFQHADHARSEGMLRLPN